MNINRFEKRLSAIEERTGHNTKRTFAPYQNGELSDEYSPEKHCLTLVSLTSPGAEDFPMVPIIHWRGKAYTHDKMLKVADGELQ